MLFTSEISRAFKAKRVTLREFGKIVGLSHTTVKDILDGHVPSDESVINIAKALDLNVIKMLLLAQAQKTDSWTCDIYLNILRRIFDENGREYPQLIDSSDENTMHLIPSRTSFLPESRIIVSGDVRAEEHLKEHAVDYRAIPLYESGRLAAGHGGAIFNDSEPPESMVVVYKPELGRKGRAAHNLVAARVGGESMEPTIPQGAIVIIDLDDKVFDPRRIFGVRLPDYNEVAIKRVHAWPQGQGFILVSDNPEFPPETVVVDWPELCLGRAIWLWRSLEEV